MNFNTIAPSGFCEIGLKNIPRLEHRNEEPLFIIRSCGDVINSTITKNKVRSCHHPRICNYRTDWASTLPICGLRKEDDGHAVLDYLVSPIQASVVDN